MIIVDKEDADERAGIFMIDASHDFIKDGNKNRLREEDIYKIVTTYKKRIEITHYSRFVPNEEIKQKNGYNLNISRYIDSGEREDIQDITAHLHGGIPMADIDAMEKYWTLFPKMKNSLFSVMREGYYRLVSSVDEVRDIIHNDAEFVAYADKIEAAFESWKSIVDAELRSIDEETDIKAFIVDIAEQLVKEFESLELISKYDVYEVLLSYWNETMADDAFIIKYDGYSAGRETSDIVEVSKGKDGSEKEKYKGWEGKLIPKTLLSEMFFADKNAEIAAAQQAADDAQTALDEFIEAHSDEDDYLVAECSFDDDGKEGIDGKKVTAKLKEFKKSKIENDDSRELAEYQNFVDTVKAAEKKVKELTAALDKAVREKYADLTDTEVKELLINRKWYATIYEGIQDLYSAASHTLAARICELGNRYKETLPELSELAENYEVKVKAHLERMGIIW